MLMKKIEEEAVGEVGSAEVDVQVSKYCPDQDNEKLWPAMDGYNQGKPMCCTSNLFCATQKKLL